ncbi:phd-finger protein [Plasmopara halstedii]|uniref:Phd-finger protein n=1 Tax=Plasmopara halstedii TaxID=4781 RepID=A0A0P1AVA3_PLAHL|nr:phd-finger protein [Plasmopara halstedii]CEG45319.1 phd-finger protein [Plasmopara halstedii]|eukprot:XP_024581688.1 phd-finger protein [Plasmopara halstedii]
MLSNTMGCNICGQHVTSRSSAFLIECYYCSRWLHGDCAQVSEQDALLIAKFACIECQHHGHEVVKYSSLETTSFDLHSMPFTPLPIHLSSNESSTPLQLRHVKSSREFRQLLSTAIYARSGVHVVSSQDVRPCFLYRNALDEPVLITGNNYQAAGLNEPFPVLDKTIITNLLTQNRELRAIDVATQSNYHLTAPMWQTILSKSNEHDALLINVEFQLYNLPIQCQVAPPLAVTQVDWQKLIMSKIHENNSKEDATSNIFAAFLERNAYLDFIIVPSGQSTWLSVSSGELWVFLIPPTSVNFEAYRKWRKNSDFVTLFLPEQVNKCIKCVVRTGHSLLIPAGWMFARYAGEMESCSLFFGYFACTAALEAQMEIVLLEMQHDTLKDTTSTWLAVDSNMQLWTAVCYYIRQLAVNNNGKVNDLERRVLQRALPRLKEWSVQPASLKIVRGMSWIPTSQQEAQTIISQLEQALDVPTCSLEDLERTYEVNNDVNISPIPLSEATCIYSAASISNDQNQSTWDLNYTAYSNLNSSTPMESTWPSYTTSPQHLQQYPDENLTHNQPYQSNVPCFQQPTLFHNLQEYGDSDYKHIPTGLDSYTFGCQGQTTLDNAVPHSLHTSFENQPRNLDYKGQYVDMLRHRASCHRCGNLRKNNVQCSVCPHIFCAKCAEKMIEEHGNQIFEIGCPVCKELCCCGKNRSISCTHKFHCYKKCPSTKRPTFG